MPADPSEAESAAPAAGGDEPRWITTDADLAALVGELEGIEAYAIDTEFHRERTYYAHLALVQLAWDGGVALIDPLSCDARGLEPLLASDAVAVLHASEQDLEIFERQCGRLPTTLFDTQVAAGFLGWSTPSLSFLARDVLHIDLPKGDRLTDWTARPLTAQQERYAAADVAHLLDLRAELCRRLAERDRTSWAEEECALLLQRSRGGQDPDRAWWRIKEARQLRGKARLIAQEVAAWRERRAMETDRPVRQILPDLAIVGIATKPPRTPDDVGSVRGFEGRRLPGAAGRELVEVVAAAQKLPESALRLPPVDDVARPLRAAVGLVSAWVSQLARDLSIDTPLLGTRSDIEALLRGDEDARLAHGWRAEQVGEPIRKLVSGEAALAFDRDGSLVLEARSHTPITPAPPT